MQIPCQVGCPLVEGGLESEQESQVVDVGLCRAGDEQVVQGMKEGVRVVACQVGVGIETQRLGACQAGSADHGPCGFGGAIAAVGGQSEQENLLQAGQVGTAPSATS